MAEPISLASIYSTAKLWFSFRERARLFFIEVITSEIFVVRNAVLTFVFLSPAKISVSFSDPNPITKTLTPYFTAYVKAACRLESGSSQSVKSPLDELRATCDGNEERAALIPDPRLVT